MLSFFHYDHPKVIHHYIYFLIYLSLHIIMLDHKGCKPKCRFSQVINHGKSEIDPQRMIRHERIILTILQKRKKK
jgi:hypothetical protein